MIARRNQDHNDDIERNRVYMTLPQRPRAGLRVLQQSGGIHQPGRPAGHEHETLQHECVDQRAKYELPVRARRTLRPPGLGQVGDDEAGEHEADPDDDSGDGVEHG